MKLLITTAHFKPQEFLVSATAKKYKIDNTPQSDLIVDNLNNLIVYLEEVRTKFGHSICISSGYRCPKLNTKVGGSKTSLHVLGMAADCKCYDNLALFEFIRDNFDYDQLINEYDFSWVHVSIKPKGLKNRKQILVIK